MTVGMNRPVRPPEIFGEDTTTYAVLDGASAPDLQDQLHQLRPEHECLYRGDLKPDLAEVAPYLVRLEPGSEFAEWVVATGWGKHWGVFAVVRDADFKAVHRHFRTFLVVHDPDGKPLYFRYYDPRVLRVYLPTCNGEELKQVFGPVERFVMEGEDPETACVFRLAGGALVKEEETLEPVKEG